MRFIYSLRHRSSRLVVPKTPFVFSRLTRHLLLEPREPVFSGVIAIVTGKLQWFTRFLGEALPRFTRSPSTVIPNCVVAQHARLYEGALPHGYPVEARP